MTTPASLPRSLPGLLCLAFFLAVSLRAETPAAITPGEGDAYGETLAGYFNEGKQAEVVRQIDVYSLVSRITRGLEMSDKDKAEFQTGFSSSFSSGLQNSLRLFTASRYLRQQEVGGEKRLLLRVVSEEGAVNFLAFIIARRANGALKCVDFHSYLTGEMISETARRGILPMVARQNKSFLEKLTTKESAYVTNMPKINQGVQLLQQNKFAEAQKVFEALPAELKAQRYVLALRLRIAQQLDEKDYLRVISEWETALPGDPSLDLVSIDGDIMRKDFAGAINRLDGLSRQIGGDNYLTFLQGNLHLMAGDYAQARKSARAALAAEPSLTSAWDTLLNTSLKEKKYDETVSLLTEFGALYPHADMKSIVDGEATYADFRTTEAYSGWTASLQANKETATDAAK